MAEHLPAINASLNALSGVLLVLGLILIKRDRREAHRRTMLAATAVSAIFLACYLTYHLGVQKDVGPTPFRREGVLKVLYLVMLLTHVVLATVNLPFILRVLWLAKKEDWERHRKLARIVWPSWFYVSVTGVLVYFALYHWNLPADSLG
ncbi:MAG: putative membrane protein [Planctomycetota bacterium]|jgi:putative membrane protein